MNTIHLTDEELGMARHALEAYLRAFGHDEADVLHGIKSVLEKFQTAESGSDTEEPHFIA